MNLNRLQNFQQSRQNLAFGGIKRTIGRDAALHELLVNTFSTVGGDGSLNHYASHRILFETLMLTTAGLNNLVCHIKGIKPEKKIIEGVLESHPTNFIANVIDFAANKIKKSLSAKKSA